MWSAQSGCLATINTRKEMIMRKSLVKAAVSATIGAGFIVGLSAPAMADGTVSGSRSCGSTRTLATYSTTGPGAVAHAQASSSGGNQYSISWYNDSQRYRYYNVGLHAGSFAVSWHGANSGSGGTCDT